MQRTFIGRGTVNDAREIHDWLTLEEVRELQSTPGVVRSAILLVCQRNK